MIWIIVFILIVISSTILAVWRFMTLTKRIENIQTPVSLFIVQNRSILTPPLLESIIHELPRPSTISFEILKKGQDHVLVMAVPRWIITNHPEIKVLEIEDYLPSTHVSVQNTLCLQFADPKLKMIKSNLFTDIFSELQLQNGESLFIQLIARASSPTVEEFDANIRVFISSKDHGRSTEIQEQFLSLLDEKSSLGLNTRDHNSAEILSNYRARTFAKHETLMCPLNTTDLNSILL